MTVASLLKKIEKERKQKELKIKKLEEEIIKKENNQNVFIANTRWERFQIQKLKEELRN